MHKECFEELCDTFVKRIQRYSKTLSDSEIRKAMFDEGRYGKYDLIRKECKCGCGGLFKVPMSMRGVFGDATDTPITEKKKKTKSRVTTMTRMVDINKEEGEIDDADLQQYIWHGSSKQEGEANAEEAEQKAVDLNDGTYPDLPFSGSLPKPLKNVASTGLRRTVPSFRLYDYKTFHVITVSKDNMDLWRPRLIGRGGKHISKLEKDSCCRISMHESNDSVRITVTGSGKTNRETCCVLVQSYIEKVFP